MRRLRGAWWLCVACALGTAALGDRSAMRLQAAAPPQPSVSIRRNPALNFNVWPGDFNGDGIVDLVASQAWVDEPPRVIVAFGKGDGTYAAPIVTGIVGRVLAVADFNEDGKADLLWEELPEDDPTVWVATGNGDGTFGQSHMVSQPRFVYFARVADLDGDGHLDVVLGQNSDQNADRDEVLIVPGNGDGSFAVDGPRISIPASGPFGAAVADFTGDGRPDLAVANHDGQSLTLLLNHGAFTFAAVDVPLDRQANDAVAADVDRDGKMDVLVAATRGCEDDLFSCDGYVYVMPGRGDGTFGTPTEYQTRNGAWRIVTGDFNRDGVMDVATANRSARQAEDFCGFLWDTVSILPGLPGGAFGPASSFSLGSQSNLADTRFRDSVQTLAVADLNKDGAPDLVVSWGALLINQPPDPDWAPTVAAHASTPDANHTVVLTATADDVDQDALTYRWSETGGQSIEPTPAPCPFTPTTLGVHTFTVTVDDGHGHSASSSVTVDFGGSGGGSTPPTIAIVNPAEGSTIAAGTPYTLKVHIDDPSMAVYEWTIDYSVDNGTTWNHIWECHLIGQPSQPGVPTSRDETCRWANPGPASPSAEFVAYAQDDADAPVATSPVVHASIAAASGAVPDPWKHQDVGAVGAAGTATYDNGIFSVTGSGADIWSAADEFHYTYSDAYGDLTADALAWEITTRIDSLQNVQPWTKAGLMIRDGLGAGARHASIFVTPGKGVAFQRRTTTGGASVSTSGPPLGAPIWLKLGVTGATVSAYYRKSPTDPWTLVGRDTLSAAFSQPLMGLAVTSHQDGTRATAAFSQVDAHETPTLTSDDVGTSGGSTTTDNVVTAMTADGADVWGTSDQFRFAHADWNLIDGSVTVRVRSVQNTNAWTKAGVMFREETLGGAQLANARYVFVMVTPGKGVTLQYRDTTGGSAASAGAAIAGAAPGWLRLTKSGATFTGAWSKDGVTWTTVGTAAVAFGNARLATGLALTSHSTAPATASFDDFRIREK